MSKTSKFEKFENTLLIAWNSLAENYKSGTKVTINNIEALNEIFCEVYRKVQIQREELEFSRDNWKKKYYKLKNSVTISNAKVRGEE